MSSPRATDTDGPGQAHNSMASGSGHVPISTIPASETALPLLSQTPATVGSASLDANLRQLALLQALVARQRAQVVASHHQHYAEAVQKHDHPGQPETTALAIHPLSPTHSAAQNQTQTATSPPRNLPQWSSFLEGLNSPLPQTPPPPPPPSTPLASTSLDLPWSQGAPSGLEGLNALVTGQEEDASRLGALRSANENLARQQQVELDWWAHTVFTHANGEGTDGAASVSPTPSPELSTFRSLGPTKYMSSALQSPVNGPDNASEQRRKDWVVPSPPPQTPFDWSSLYAQTPGTVVPLIATVTGQSLQAISGMHEARSEDEVTGQPAGVKHSLASASARRPQRDDFDELEEDGAGAEHSGTGRAAGSRPPAYRQRSRRAGKSSSVVSVSVAADSSGSDTVSPQPLSLSMGATQEEVDEDRRRRNTAASARFRAKKKARDQQLEQSTFQLRSRVEELENEKKSLTAENKWLKDLVSERAKIRPEVREMVHSASNYRK